MEQKTELKDRIAQARKAAGLSQEQLGEKLGVSRQAISKWESGAANPDVAYLAAMCRELGVSSDWLLLGEEPDGAPPPPRRCPQCGGGVIERDSFCPHCGTPLTGEDRPDRYTLLLPVPEGQPYTANKAVSRLSGCSWARRGTPWKKKLRLEDAAGVVASAPVILCRGLTRQQVGEALSCFQDAKDYPLIYRDTDGDTPEELGKAAPVSWEHFYILPYEKGGMTFGMTVLAVVVGLIAYGLLLSVLSAVFL